ncbi:hypothetical protein L1987_19150 [Smallanthus sonchifolius]|uniref:Uncharacterized protein n=1 Tax=Smallanthus sonchifolius TaxID=185202 RepID=A0ACB9J289_9ASTR|nr:hypothetical protein L1987_19150 [Smallanthus sonchifolius]
MISPQTQSYRANGTSKPSRVTLDACITVSVSSLFLCFRLLSRVTSSAKCGGGGFRGDCSDGGGRRVGFSGRRGRRSCGGRGGG